MFENIWYYDKLSHILVSISDIAPSPVEDIKLKISGAEVSLPDRLYRLLYAFGMNYPWIIGFLVMVLGGAYLWKRVFP